MTARWLSRERVILLAALAAVTALAWLYLLVAAQRMSAAGMAAMPGPAVPGPAMPSPAVTGPAMTGSAMTSPAVTSPAMTGPATDLALPVTVPLGVAMPGMAMPPAWDAARIAATFAMWWVMMLGMMLPSATPMILLYATIARRQRHSSRRFVPTSVFVAGYLLAWGAFSAAASALQWGLDRAALLSPMMQTKGAVIGGTIFLLAGIYQFTPFKTVCLRHCRSPFAFLLNHWRDGWSGALAMGWHHGLYCLGCCWVLMLVLFAVGVMNLAWVAVLTAFVLLEKAVPRGIWVGRVAGALMLAFGVYWLAGAA